MTPIVESLSGENRIILRYQERFARKPLFIDTLPWTKLRIGFRMCMEDRGTNLIQASLCVGLCSGGSSIGGDGAFIYSNATHAYYVRIQGAFTTWIRNTGAVRYSSTFMNGETTVNGALVGSSADLEASTMATFCSPTSRTVLMFDITKGSPNFTGRVFRNTATAGADISKATFAAQMPATTPVIAGHSYATAGAWACNPTANGTLDHVNISWRNHEAVIISDLTVAYLS